MRLGTDDRKSRVNLHSFYIPEMIQQQINYIQQRHSLKKDFFMTNPVRN
jgi:hypothetical protein